MRDDFVGDIGDFGKYALLNALVGSDLTLFVNWYFNSQRGRAFQYLRQEKKYGGCSPELYAVMQEIAKEGPSRLKQIESRRVLPEKTIFFAEPLDAGGIFPRDHFRKKWHLQALEKAKKADIVFLDPDNGLESERRVTHLKQVSKYFSATTEVRDYVRENKSLILYQHFHRKGSHEVQIKATLKRVSLATGIQSWGIRFGSVSPRVYVVVPSVRHRAKLKARILAFASGKCRKPLRLKIYDVETNT